MSKEREEKTRLYIIEHFKLKNWKLDTFTCQ